MAEAGATPVQEIAFTLANAKEYVAAALASGLAVDEFAPRLSFFFVARTTLLEEVAKFRAARRLWARIMREEFKARDPKSQMLRFHTQTAGVQLTAQQKELNLARVTIQALAAVLGGTQSLHTNSYDEAIALPTEKSARLALRTQQVIAAETDLTRTVDPFAGSYAVESMTDEIEAAATGLMTRIDEMGGALAAIERGFQKSEIERSAYEVARQTDDGRRVVVGVNKYASADEEPYEPLRVDPGIEQAQAGRLRELRAGRDDAAVRKTVDAREVGGGGHRQRTAAGQGRAAGGRDARRGLRRAARGMGRLPATGVLTGALTGVTGRHWSNRFIRDDSIFQRVETLEGHPFGARRRGHPWIPLLEACHDDRVELFRWPDPWRRVGSATRRLAHPDAQAGRWPRCLPGCPGCWRAASTRRCVMS